MKINNTVYKETSIGLIPEDWNIERFDNVFELLSTNSFSRDNLIYEETKNQIQNIHYGDIHSKFNNEILDCGIEKLPYIKDDLILNQKFNFLKDGDLIIADASEDYEGVGKCIEVKNIGSKKVVSGLHTFMARDNSGLTANGFRTYIFNNQKVSIELKKIATGTSVYSISKSYLQKLKLPIPPITEQQKIGEILSKFDEAINIIILIIDELKLRNKGLVNKLILDNGELKVKLGSVFVESKIPTTNADVNKRITVRLTLKGIEKRGVRGSELEEATTYYLRKSGQFIYGKQNLHKGAFGIIPDELDGFESSSDIPAFDISKEFNSKYIFYYFTRRHFYEKLEDISTGTGSKRIQPRELFKVEIKVPSTLEKQIAIVKIIDTATKELNKYEQKLETLQLQKKGLMQQLLTGKTRVKI